MLIEERLSQDAITKSHRKMSKNIKKLNEYALESGAEMAIIKKELEKIKFEVETKHIKSHDKI